MHCRHCNYDLSGLRSGRCPECGATAQDPLRLPRKTERRLLLWGSLFALWPTLLTAWVHLMYVVAAIHLDRWPYTSGQDDPKHLPGVGMMYNVALLAFFAIPFALLAALMLATKVGLSEPRLGLLVGSLVFAGIGIPIVLGDPVSAWVWFWD